MHAMLALNYNINMTQVVPHHGRTLPVTRTLVPGGR